MAPKNPSHSRQPSKEMEEKEKPTSDEEEDDDEVEESGSETEADSSEDEQKDQEKQKLGQKSAISEDGSDSDSESEDNPSAYKLQRILKPHGAPSKRAHEESESMESSKKPKTEEKKKSGTWSITRLWSNEDEIAVLNGMVEFKNQKGLDSIVDMGAFHNYLKGKLQGDYSKDQMRSKISRLKKRFLNAVKKSENGVDPEFSNPYEHKAYKISKKIWGGVAGNSKGVKNVEKREDAKKEIMEEEEKSEVDEKEIVVKKEKDGEEFDWSKYPFLSASFRNVGGNYPSLAKSESGVSFMKDKLSSIGNAKAKELNEKWKKMFVEEAELNHKMLNLMSEQVKMALE